MVAIKNKCGMDGGDRKHSLAMSEEFMSRMFAWSDETCPASRYEEKSSTVEEQNLKTKHFGVQICFELIKLQRKHLTFGLEDSKAFNTPYFELQLTNRKGWQKRVNKTDKEADLRNGKFKICAQPDLPACDSFTWMTRWVQYLEEDIYKCPLNPDDYIFPATGANGIVQTGEHISHDDVQKWITEFAAGADLPRANGTFSTHCFRRGGAQYRFMFAPVGRRWTLRQIKASSAKLLQLLQQSPKISRCFISRFPPTYALSTEFDKLLRIVAAAVTAPARPLPDAGLIVPDVPITLLSGAKSERSESWIIIVQHWEDGDAEHGLTTSLKDWPKDWLRGTNKPLAMKHTQQRIIATEFIDHYKRDKQSFLEAYPEANQGSSALLGAINKAREARGNRIARK
ncbi:hypothetical protein R3P38DRAFT_2786544 [Favolaschia claudopus]|uniref:Tyr recombinase domain-containing protein n=1 Tax=Favolaschia claudopus TaxID=2862362 RepID=A0AAW0ARJ5_9AGAR